MNWYQTIELILIVTLISIPLGLSLSEAAGVKEPPQAAAHCFSDSTPLIDDQPGGRSEPDPRGDEQVHHGDDTAGADGHRHSESESQDAAADFEISPPPSPPPVTRKRSWKWRTPQSKRQAIAAATAAASSSSSARPTGDSLTEPMHTEATVAIESETALVPAEAVESPVAASELANPVPLQPAAAAAAPDLEPPATAAAVEIQSPVPASELANPVPLQPAVPELEPPAAAESESEAAGVDIAVPKAKVSWPINAFN